MMRSLYSGVAGLKTHQTKMDVIGNNIANVNTNGFKSSSVNFSDTYYQTVSSATGANAELGTAGVNAKQIGLGSMVAAIQTNITEQGGPSTTNRALDIAINGEAFMVVRNQSGYAFTKSGALNIDESGNLYCTTNDTIVQGWVANEDGTINKDTVQDLRVMSADNQYYPPEETRAVTISGNLDPNDPDLDLTTGQEETQTFSFYDKIGEPYTVVLKIKQHNPPVSGTPTNDYDVRVADVLNADGESIFVTKTVNATTGAVSYAYSGAQFSFGGTASGAITVSATTGEVTIPDTVTKILSFSTSTGNFVSVNQTRTRDEYDGSLNFCITQMSAALQGDNTTFTQYVPATDSGGVNVFFNSITQYSQGGSTKLNSNKGRETTDGYVEVGNVAGKMSGISVDKEGKVWGTYNNGLKKCLAQIAFATFANPSGLEAIGNSLFAASLNSGDFDGVGEEISLSGSLTPGALEMSNVDLANEFTNMITTQRGFQANSRIITTSDSILEELVNLKR